MRFTYYTEKTPSQAITAINARMQVKESAARVGLDGWVEKNGAFALSVSSKVIGRFHRRTVLRGKIERESGMTVVRGDVPNGVDKQGQMIIFVALALVAVLIITSGNVAPALIILPLGAYLYIPMTGDRVNSAVLLSELQKTLKARHTPPKKESAARAGAARASAAKAVSDGSTATRRASVSKSGSTTRKPAGASTGGTKAAKPASTPPAPPPMFD